ncbi:MAG: hypothetical protein CM15mP21_5930 [Hyphomicrobiales bacterium]|nr:MAG: hypothetical protein CM15mP21_5930 [Hyphomicrobiales bacterium]
MSLTGDDCREGLTAVLSVKVPDPKFSSQTKDKLCPRKCVRLSRALSMTYSPTGLRNTNEAREIINKVVEAAAAREAAQSPRIDRRKGALDVSSLPGSWPIARSVTRPRRIVHCRGRQRRRPAKQARNRSNQAVLPLRGKI